MFHSLCFTFSVFLSEVLLTKKQLDSKNSLETCCWCFRNPTNHLTNYKSHRKKLDKLGTSSGWNQISEPSINIRTSSLPCRHLPVIPLLLAVGKHGHWEPLWTPRQKHGEKKTAETVWQCKNTTTPIKGPFKSGPDMHLMVSMRNRTLTLLESCTRHLEDNGEEKCYGSSWGTLEVEVTRRVLPF